MGGLKRKSRITISSSEDECLTIVRKKSPHKPPSKRPKPRKRPKPAKTQFDSESSDEELTITRRPPKKPQVSPRRTPRSKPVRKSLAKPSSESVSEYSEADFTDPENYTDSDSDADLSGFVVTDSSVQSDCTTSEGENEPKVATKTKTRSRQSRKIQNSKAVKSEKSKINSKSKKSTAKKFSTLSAELSDILGPKSQSVAQSKLQGALTRRLFTFFNENIFGGILAKNTRLSWNSRMISAAGRCNYGKKAISIELSPVIIKNDKFKLRDILLHEIVHGVAYTKDKKETGHGKLFYALADMVERKLPRIPRVTRCHEYKIAYKFTYYCVDCGQKYGRQRRTINVKIDTCGECRGRLKLKGG